MKLQFLVQSYNKVISHRNRLMVFVWGSLLLNMLMAFCLSISIGREKVIVVPPVTSNQFWVAADSVSDSYLEQISEFFASLVLNVTPSNYAARREQLLQHVDPSTYAAVKSQLMEQEGEITRRGMSTTFHPSSFKVDRSKLVVEIKGELRVLLGNSSVELNTRNYQIDFKNRNGRLYILKFKELKNA